MTIGRITELIRYGNTLHITFKYSSTEFQDLTVEDTEENKRKICDFFGVGKINAIIGRYAECLLTEPECGIINGLRLLKPDQSIKNAKDLILK